MRELCSNDLARGPATAAVHEVHTESYAATHNKPPTSHPSSLHPSLPSCKYLPYCFLGRWTRSNHPIFCLMLRSFCGGGWVSTCRIWKVQVVQLIKTSQEIAPCDCVETWRINGEMICEIGERNRLWIGRAVVEIQNVLLPHRVRRRTCVPSCCLMNYDYSSYLIHLRSMYKTSVQSIKTSGWVLRVLERDEYRQV